MYRLEITPKATPRPRVKTLFSKKLGRNINATYYPIDYQAYKDKMISMIKELNITPKDYNYLIVKFALPYPKTVVGGRKMKIEGKLHDKKPDLDNQIKGFSDFLNDAGAMLTDDSKIGIIQSTKVYTCSEIGYVEFNLAVI